MPTPYLSFSSPIVRGPILAHYRRRALLLWMCAAVIGILPVLLGLAPALRAAGLGLWLPGGGYLYAGYPVLFVITLGLFAVSLLGWLLMGGFIYPPTVWTLTMVHAAYLTRDGGQGWAQIGVPALALLLLVVSVVRERMARQKAQTKADAIQRRLATVPLQAPCTTPIVSEPLDDQEMGALRFTLDLALQPIDEFKGFVTIDQFREAAWRYQLVSINYSLAILQTSRIPAFRGYLHEAQRRAIVKMQDRRVWKYWRVENFVGNLGLNPNPVEKENIMYSGWWALALGAYERATGDLSFSQPGALPLRENASIVWNYDYAAISHVLARNFDSHGLCFFPCEPNWVFSVCNLYGMTGLLTYDKVHGTRLGLDRLERFNKIMETEFTSGEGKASIIASNRTGLAITSEDFNAFVSVIPLMNMVSPRLAQVYWEIGMAKLTEKFGDDPSRWEATGSGNIDPGNYQRNQSFFWGGLMRSARELGHENVYEVARQRYDALGIVEREGALHWQGSVFSQLNGQMGRFATKDAWHRLAHGELPPAIHSGPLLDSASYPDVLVAGADNDGRALHLTLCAGRAAGRQPLTLARLLPGQRYSVTNTTASDGTDTSFVADGTGAATIHAYISQRSTIVIRPDVA